MAPLVLKCTMHLHQSFQKVALQLNIGKIWVEFVICRITTVKFVLLLYVDVTISAFPQLLSFGQSAFP